MQPAVAAAGEKDGRFPLQEDVSGLMAADIASFIVVGKEAAAAGRPRDAEVAFLMSCRLADKLKGADSVESADAKYQLGAHYARVALDGGLAAGANRAEVLRRAERLYAGSLSSYAAHYGQAHEKSRFASQGLASVRQTLAQAEPVRPAPGPAAVPAEPATAAVQSSSKPSRASVPQPRPHQAKVARAAAPALQKPGAAAQFSPSFDCAKARSVPEKMICADAELARLDRELARVYARAKNSAADPAAFRRQQDLEWRRREAICRDRGCLLRWYAHRRDQLTNGTQQGRGQPQPASSR
ncbi:MAG: hypothetical protein JWP96_2270 [Polaromonas sp.]|nr:hypothetical protein [Polaromonas sp.]